MVFFITAPTLSLSSEEYVVVETEGSVEVCVDLNIPLLLPLDFIIAATPINATAGMSSLVKGYAVSLFFFGV